VISIAGNEIQRYHEVSAKPRTKNFIGYWSKRVQDPSFFEDRIKDCFRSDGFWTMIPIATLIYLFYDHIDVILGFVTDMMGFFGDVPHTLQETGQNVNQMWEGHTGELKAADPEKYAEAMEHLRTTKPQFYKMITLNGGTG